MNHSGWQPEDRLEFSGCFPGSSLARPMDTAAAASPKQMFLPTCSPLFLKTERRLRFPVERISTYTMLFLSPPEATQKRPLRLDTTAPNSAAPELAGKLDLHHSTSIRTPRSRCLTRDIRGYLRKPKATGTAGLGQDSKRKQAVAGFRNASATGTGLFGEDWLAGGAGGALEVSRNAWSRDSWRATLVISRGKRHLLDWTPVGASAQTQSMEQRLERLNAVSLVKRRPIAGTAVAERTFKLLRFDFHKAPSQSTRRLRGPSTGFGSMGWL